MPAWQISSSKLGATCATCATPFVDMLIWQNARMLGVCTCVPIRERLQRVLKAQQDLAKSAGALKEWVRMEKRAHRAFKKISA